MRIVSWNCHYGFDANKSQKIKEICPNTDIFVIQECMKSDFDVLKTEWQFKNWYCDDLNDEKSLLGIAVFSNKFKIEFTDIFNRKYRYVVPYKVSDITGEGKSFMLFAVWTKKEPLYYDKNVIEAIKHYHIEKQSIVIGDYNTFAKDVNTKYPPLVNCAKNFEAERSTFYSQRHGFGIDDFCFATSDIANNIDVKICQDSEKEWEWEGDGEKLWHNLSDHCPIIADYNLKG
jgi:exonuclease III